MIDDENYVHSSQPESSSSGRSLQSLERIAEVPSDMSVTWFDWAIESGSLCCIITKPTRAPCESMMAINKPNSREDYSRECHNRVREGQFWPRP